MLSHLWQFRWASLWVAFLFLWAAQVYRSAYCRDEAAHIPAGLCHIETGNMEPYRVNPPLPRMLAALPLLLDGPQLEWYGYDSPYKRVEFELGGDWLKDHQPSTRRHLMIARSTVLLFIVIGAWAIARWSDALYGAHASFLATSLWLLNPDVLTHSAVVAPDLPASAAGLLAGYTFWNWLKLDNRPIPWAVAVTVAFAVLCKFSWLFLLPLLPLITLIYDAANLRKGQTEVPDSSNNSRSRALSIFNSPIKLTCSFFLTLIVINVVYGFDGTGKRLGDYSFISPALTGTEDLMRTGNRFSDSLIGQMPVPLPEQMILGLDFLRWEFSEGKPCYLRGDWQHGGWWYYYLYAMAVKMPLGYWLLIIVGLFTLAWDRVRNRQVFPLEWLPPLFAFIFIALVSSQTGFTHHVRYVLPAYGFLLIVAARPVAVLPKRIAIAVVAICLAGTVWFHANHLGTAHTFFNSLAGGPNNGWRHLSHSNVDWGQSTYRMADWVNEHPEHRPITVIFTMSHGNPEVLIEDSSGVFTLMQMPNRDGNLTPTPGWYLISSIQMTQEQNRFFRHQDAIAQPYADVLLFRILE